MKQRHVIPVSENKTFSKEDWRFLNIVTTNACDRAWIPAKDGMLYKL